ncbi:MAG: type II toxin-antitoxin system HicB family antitoxin [Akkermansiaceae bacterium]|nr:type II toxin-antitoxin system HicB family antitoxin [Akkermansiaceae bacterium]
MKTRLPYQITIAWSAEDEGFVASVPALGGCIAYGETAEEAVREIQIAAELWLEVAEKRGKTIPTPDATLERIAALAPI